MATRPIERPAVAIAVLLLCLTGKREDIGHARTHTAFPRAVDGISRARARARGFPRDRSRGTVRRTCSQKARKSEVGRGGEREEGEEGTREYTQQVVNRRGALEFDVELVGAKRAISIRECKVQSEFPDRGIPARARAFGFKFEFKSCRANRRREPATRGCSPFRAHPRFCSGGWHPVRPITSDAVACTRPGTAPVPSSVSRTLSRRALSSAREFVGVESFVFANRP